MDLNSTRTAANTITDEATKPKTYGDTLHDFFIQNRSTFEPGGVTPKGLAQKAYEAHGASTGKDYDTWANEVGLGDFVPRTQSRLAELKAEDEWKASQPEDRGVLGTIGAAIGRGSMDFVSQAGHALSVADADPTAIDTDKGILDKVGGSMVDWAEETREKSQALRQTKQEEAEANTPGVFEGGGMTGLKKELLSGLESVPLSLGSAAVGAGLGAGLAVAAPAIGIGAGAAAVIGGLASLGALFFGGEYDRQVTEQLDAVRKANPSASEQEVIGKTKELAREIAGWEAGTEVLSDLVSGAIAIGTGGLGLLARAPIKNGVKGMLKPGLKTFLKRTALGALATVPSESGTEMLNAAMQDRALADAGLEHHGEGKAALQAFIPSLVPTLFFGIGGASYGKVRAGQLLKDINSEDAEVRARAAGEIASGIKENAQDEDLAKSWLTIAHQHIVEGKPIDVDADIASFAASQTRREAEAEGRPIAPNFTPQDVASEGVRQTLAPKSEAEKMLTGDADVTPTDILMGADERPAPIPGQNEAWLDQQEAAWQREQAEATGQAEDLDAEWKNRAEERQVAADTRMLDAEWDARQRIQELEREIKSLSTGRGKGTKKRMAAAQEAKRELKRLRDTLGANQIQNQPVSATSSPAVGNMPVEPVQNLHELAPTRGTASPAVAQTMAVAQTQERAKLEKKVANLESLGTRASKTQMRNLEAYRAELDAMDAQDGATLDAEARGVEEFGPATAGSGKENFQVDAQVVTTNAVVDQNVGDVRDNTADLPGAGPVTAPSQGEASPKEPWKMTSEEYASEASKAYASKRGGAVPARAAASVSDAAAKRHARLVKQAISEGKQVPAEVLAEYPDLQPPTLPADQRTMEQAGGMASPGQRPSFEDMVKDAARWRGAARNLARELEGDKRASVRISKITTKGDLDAYLMRKYGLDAADARSVSNHLTAQNIPDDMTATVEEFADEPWAKEARQTVAPNRTQPTTTATESKPAQEFKPAESQEKTAQGEAKVGGDQEVGGYTLKPISEKAFVVTGDTKPIKDKLKAAGGKWMGKHGGWMFPERHRAKVEKLLGVLKSVPDEVLDQTREKLLEGYRIDIKQDAAGKTYKMVAPDGQVLTYVSPSASTLPQKHADQLLTAMVEHFTGQRTAPDREMDPVLSLTSSDGEIRYDVVQRKDGKFAVAMRDIDTEKTLGDVRVYSTREAAERYARDEFKKYEDANKAETEGAEEKGVDAVVEHFAKKLYSGAKYTNIVQARKEAAEIMGEKVQSGTDLAKIVDEAIELAVVKTARRMIREMRKAGASDLEIYRDLVALYAQHPSLNVRTSTSVQQQAYSTPVPIAFLASRLAGIKGNTRVLEPTAGNGMLLIEADHPVVNELNPDRAARLRSLGFKVGEMDAASEEFVAKVRDHVDAVIANPPFGRVRDENGEAKSWTVAGYETKELDHAIALRSLELLLPDGKAVLIIGGKQGEGKNRAMKYQSVAQRQFYNALFENFKVVDHFTIDGKLYSKQGAGFPIDIIVIDGRGKTTGRKFPAVNPPAIYESFEALEEKFNERHMDAGDRVGSGNAEDAGRMDGDRQQGKPDRARGDKDQGVDSPVGRAGVGSQALSDDAGRGGADRPVSGREGAGKGEQVGDIQPAGQAGTGEQDLRPGGREQEGLPPQAEQQGAGLVQRDDAAGLGERGSDVSLDALMGEWDRQEEASKPKQEPQSKPSGEKSAAQVFADNAAELKANLAAALDAFSKFGGMSVKIVKDGDQINQTLYEAIRPHLLAAYQNLKAMGMAGQQLIREFVTQARAVFGDKASQARPYFEKFAGEIVEMERSAAKTTEKPAPEKKEAKQESAQSGTALQDPYTPRSKSSSMGTLVPKNMTNPLRNALDKLEEGRGNIDEYVAKELGYSAKEMEEYFAGEQIDAIALAIHNIDKGAGFIIGDQTGIGKGRVNAAIMRYAKRKGAVPVFVTMKPDLYADMIRDLQDIGMQGFNPLPTNGGLTGDKTIPLPDGRTLRTKSGAKHTSILEEQGQKGVSDYDAVFTTYSQLQSVKGKDTPRRAFIRQIAPRAIFILDESHNAGGSESAGSRKAKDAAPTTSEFVRDVLGMTELGTFYSSATYAKRPDVMSLYFKTDMRYAVDDISKLASAISEGGIPLQQIVAAQLTESGQYIRRERSFEGASVEVAPAKADMKAAEQSATIMRSILAFDKIKQEALASIKEDAMGEGGSAEDSSATGEKGASSTNFTSIMHNLIGQSLLAMKADAAVESAKEAVARGEKPIITLANTMGSFIKGYVDAESLSSGQEVLLTFKDLYRRYLEKTRTLTKRDHRGHIIEQWLLSDDELGPEGVAAYNAVLEEIEKSNFGNLPISPIDYIKSRLEAENITVGEITGRTATVDYSGGLPVYRPRRPSPAGNIEVMRSFNSGETSCIILNQSGSTGISLHSSSKFADTNKRTMIIVQPELNIDVFMQTLGRVFRTGQVVPPSYKLLTSDLPAEKRPAAVLGKKMAGLNANTTASRKTDTTFQNIPDFLNEYGDLVTAQIMEENPEIHKALGSPLKEAEGGYERDGAVRKVTGRIPMLPLKDQQELYDMIEGEYNDLIAQLEATGTSTLEAKTLQLDAKMLSSADLTAAKDVGGESPFAAESKVGHFDVKSLGKPYSPEQVRKLVEQGRGNTPDLGKTRADTISWLEKRLETVKDEDAKSSISERVSQQYETVSDIVDRFEIGSPVVVSTKDNTYEGVIVKMEHKGSANPSAPSSWKMTIAIADAARQIIVPFSKVQLGYGQDLTIGQVAVRRSNKTIDGVLDSFSRGQTVSREKRYIAFGNVLAAYSSVGNQGQIINFEDSDGNIRAGIMFKKNATLSEIVGSADVSVPDFDNIVKFFAATGDRGVIKSADKNLTVSRGGGYWNFVTPATKAKGAQFFLNGKLIEAAGRDFIKSGNVMKITVPEQTAERMISVLRQQGFGLVAASHIDEARDVMGLKKKDEGQQAAPQYQTAPQAPTLLDIRAAFPWADSITQDGDRYVVRKGKNEFAVELVDRIDPDETAFRIAYKRAYDPKTDKIAGDYSTGTLRIAKGVGDNWTAKHEHYHFLEDMGLVTKFEQAVLDAAIKKADKAGTLGFKPTTPAENRAYFVQAALEKRDFQRKTTLGRVLQKIADFVDALVNLAVRTSRGVVRDVESGKMMGRDGNAKAMMTQAFAGYQAKDGRLPMATRILDAYRAMESAIDSGIDVDTWVKHSDEMDSAKKELASLLAESGRPVVIPTMYGTLFVHPSSKPGTAWQATRLDNNGNPFGDTIYDNAKAAFRDAIGEATPQDLVNAFSGGVRQYSVVSNTLAKGKELASDVMHRPEVFGRFKWINTQLHKALRNPAFKRIFDRFHAAAGTQSRSAARAAGLAGDILPDYSGNAKDTIKRLFGKTRDFSREDLRMVSKIMSMETLAGKNASPFSGHRLTEDELAKLQAGETITLGGNDITMSATQVKLYRQARAALDQMLNEMATSEAWKVMRGVLPEDLRDYWEVFANNPIEVQAAMENMLAMELRNAETRATQAEKALFDFAGAKDMDEAKKYGRVLELLNRALKKKDKFSDKELENDDIDALIAKREERIEKLADALGISADNADEHLAEYKKLVAADKDAKQHVLNVEDAQSKITDVFAKSQQLIKAGYAPLSRFGKYRIDVHNDKGDLIHVTFYDTSTEAARARRDLVAQFTGYPEGATVGEVETVSQNDWKLFQGANPEALRLFAQDAGAESDAAIQAYYQDAVSSRSSLKRLINRKGYAGYSDDLQRILASFITSGAKRVSSNYHAAEIFDMVHDKSLPADLRDEANDLKTFVDNPGDAGSGFRAFAANWYMLGSFMSAAWNGTQVISSTLPELYKHSGSVARSAKDIGKAYKSIFRKATDLTASEKAALDKAMEDGTVDAAEIHHLYMQASKRFIARLGDGAAAEKAGAILRLWGMPFAWFEVVNRKASFLAAYRMGEAQGMDVDEAYAFAKQIVDITQGIYVKHNRPNVARSAAGGAILTFMQYRIMTLEQISRNMKEGGQARKAAALQLAIIAAMGGWAAVPFAEDLMDILDAIMQVIGGKAWLTKKKLREAIESGSKNAAGLLLEKQAADAVGQVMADFMNIGVVSTVLPVNTQGRAGFDNLVPLVKLLKPSTQYRDSEVFEALGVPGSMAQSLMDASGMLLQGDVGRATMRLLPNALAAVAKGADIATTGEIKNTRGRKVTDGSMLDAAIQTVGGQPSRKAHINNRMRENQELKYLTQQEERSIVNEWADAYEKKGVVAQSAALKAVRERIANWNRRNPEWPIVVKQSQVMRELQNRRKTTVELAAKSAPKELRKSMAVE